MRARDNPFATDRVLRIRYRLPSGTLAGLAERLAALHFRAAIVGPKGAGKTTLLEDLAPVLGARGFRVRPLRLSAPGSLADELFAPGCPARRPTPLAAATGQLDGTPGPQDLILFDGAEQLGPLDWRRFCWRVRAAGGLLITTHRAGRLPTLIHCETSPALLEAMVGELLGDAAADWRPALPALYRKHQGNLRECLRELYDWYARQP